MLGSSEVWTGYAFACHVTRLYLGQANDETGESSMDPPKTNKYGGTKPPHFDHLDETTPNGETPNKRRRATDRDRYARRAGKANKNKQQRPA